MVRVIIKFQPSGAFFGKTLIVSGVSGTWRSLVAMRNQGSQFVLDCDPAGPLVVLGGYSELNRRVDEDTRRVLGCKRGMVEDKSFQMNNKAWWCDADCSSLYFVGFRHAVLDDSGLKKGVDAPLY